MSIPFIKQFDDFAEAMANPNPDRPIQEAVASLGRAACDRISARPELFAPTILQSPLVAACTPYWNGQGYDGPQSEPPFTGGQCAVNYGVFSNGVIIRDIFGNPQPVGEQPGPGRLGPIISIESVFNPGQFGFRQRITGQNGTLETEHFPGSFVIDKGVQTLRRVDGQPDNCGNPPEVIVPGPNPAPDPGPLPPDTGPRIDIRGNPVFVLPPTLEVSPDVAIELSPGEINLGSGIGGSAPLEPLPGDEVEGDGSGEGGGENDFDKPPDGERWVGCTIRITTTPVGAGVIPQSQPHDVYPTIIGNARLKFRSGTNPPEYDTPIAKRQETSCLWEPVRGLAPVGCFVNLLPGYNYTVRPYSVPLEQ